MPSALRGNKLSGFHVKIAKGKDWREMRNSQHLLRATARQPSAIESKRYERIRAMDLTAYTFGRPLPRFPK